MRHIHITMAGMTRAGAKTYFGMHFFSWTKGGRVFTGSLSMISIFILLTMLATQLPFASAYGVAFIVLDVQPGNNLLVNQLFTPLGTVGDMLSGQGLPDGCAVTVVNPNGKYEVNRYTMASGWTNPDMEIPVGHGFIFHNSSNALIKLVLVGSVFFGTYTNAIPAGTSLCGSVLPQAGLLHTDLGFPAANGDVVRLYSPVEGLLQSFTNTSSGWRPTEPEIGVGQAFWVDKMAATNWVRFFSFEGLDGEWLVNTPAVFGGTAAIKYPFMLATNFQSSVSAVTNGENLALNANISTALPTSYQWQVNGTNLVNGPLVQGIDGATLNLNQMVPAMRGKYSIISSNAFAFGSHQVAYLRFQRSASNSPTLVTFPRSAFSTSYYMYDMYDMEPDCDYRLQVSTNLLTWNDLHKFFTVTNSYGYVDRYATNHSRRFYRVVSP
jgi:hypothetical protein